MSRNPAITVVTIVERKQADLPRYAVVKSSALAKWKLAGTTTISDNPNQPGP